MRGEFGRRRLVLMSASFDDYYEFGRRRLVLRGEFGRRRLVMRGEFG